MIGAIAARIAEAWILCAILQGVLWFIAQKTKNAGIVDVGWAQSFTAVILVFALQPLTPRGNWLPLAIVVIAWSTRLTCYLIARGAATGREEGRYVDLRRRWALHASKRFFMFFQAQAALTAVLSLAFVVPFVTPAWDGGGLRVFGAMIAAAGVAGEAFADAQLRKFKKDPGNVGKVCDMGLWSYSRHPNYFFEWLIWIAYAVFALASPHGWVALAMPVLMLHFLINVTGLRATEEQALRTKGERYRRYQARTSGFIPWIPKRT
jgi:steroid 5-alpha reductase family enzyme